jgi:flagellar motility protein MotE (MotC chaperone)
MNPCFVRFALTIAAAFLLVPAIAGAQPRAARGRLYTKADVDRIIKRVEDRSDKFKKEFDKALDRSRLNNSRREDQLNDYAKDLEKATDELRREFDRRDAWAENKAEVRRCVEVATKINVAMRNRRLGPKVESTWSALRYELNTLADVYNLPLVGSPQY